MGGMVARQRATMRDLVTARYFGWRAGCFNRCIGALATWIMRRAQNKFEPGLEWSTIHYKSNFRRESFLFLDDEFEAEDGDSDKHDIECQEQFPPRNNRFRAAAEEQVVGEPHNAEQVGDHQGEEQDRQEHFPPAYRGGHGGEERTQGTEPEGPRKQDKQQFPPVPNGYFVEHKTEGDEEQLREQQEQCRGKHLPDKDHRIVRWGHQQTADAPRFHFLQE